MTPVVITTTDTYRPMHSDSWHQNAPVNELRGELRRIYDLMRALTQQLERIEQRLASLET